MKVVLNIKYGEEQAFLKLLWCNFNSAASMVVSFSFAGYVEDIFCLG